MTKSQRKEHKLGNAVRKLTIINTPSPYREGKKFPGQVMSGHIQDGKYVQAAREIIKAAKVEAEAKTNKS